MTNFVLKNRIYLTNLERASPPSRYHPPLVLLGRRRMMPPLFKTPPILAWCPLPRVLINPPGATLPFPGLIIPEPKRTLLKESWKEWRHRRCNLPRLTPLALARLLVAPVPWVNLPTSPNSPLTHALFSTRKETLEAPAALSPCRNNSPTC